MTEKSPRSVLVSTALLLATFSIAGCEEFITGFSHWNSSGRISRYPTQAGNRWDYERIGWTHDFRIIDSSANILRDTIRTTATVEVTGEMNLPATPGVSGDSVLVSVFRTTERESSPHIDTFISCNYLRMEPNELLHHGYRGSSLVSPRPSCSRFEFAFRGKRFAHFGQLIEYVTTPFRASAGDSIQREIPPLIVIRYPLVNGSQWTFRPAGRPWRIDKRSGPTRTGTLAGTRIRYHEVRWLYDMDNDGLWDDDIWIIDRIAESGLMGRTIEVKSVAVIGPGGPEPLGYFDYTEEIRLTSIQVHDSEARSPEFRFEHGH
jgi:hypothetical protein